MSKMREVRNEVVAKVRSRTANADRGAFESDTIYRLFREVVRYWLIEHFLRTKVLPGPDVRFIYPSGPQSLDWGDPAGEHPQFAPLRKKRIRVTIEVEDWNP